MAASASKRLASARAAFAKKEAALTGAKPNPVKKAKTKAKPRKVAKKAKTKPRKAKSTAKKATPRKKVASKTSARKAPKRKTTKRKPLSSAQIISQNRAASGNIPVLPKVTSRSQQTSLFTEANPMEIIDEAGGGAGFAAARAKVEASRMARKAAKKSSVRKTSKRKTSKKKSTRKATATGRAKTAAKVASKRGKKASAKRKTSKSKAAPKTSAPRKASKRKTSKRKSSPTSKARKAAGGKKPSKTVITQTYLSNPQVEAKDIAAFGGGLIGGILVADIVDRFVATRAPGDGNDTPLYESAAMMKIHQKVGEDPIRLLATGGGAVLSGVGAWALRDRVPTAAYGLAGVTAGFGLKVVGQLLSDYVVPYLFKSEAADDWSSRLFPDYQEVPVTDGAQDGPRRMGYTYGPYGQIGAPRPFVAAPAAGSQGAVGCGGGGGGGFYPYGANQRLARAMSSIRSRDLSKIFPQAGSRQGCPGCGTMPPNGQGCQTCGTAPPPVAPGNVPTPPYQAPPIMRKVPPTPSVQPVPRTPPSVQQPDPSFQGPDLRLQPSDSISRDIALKEAERRNFVISRGGGGNVKGPEDAAQLNGSPTVAIMRMTKRPQGKKRGRRR